MAQPAGVSYEVTAVTPDVQFNPSGPAVPGKKLTIKTSTGYEGTLFVPGSVFGDTDAVRRLIEDEVRKVAAAQAITGSVTG